MHPVLFEIPGLQWPVRLFGLFVIGAFFIATMWAQWMYVSLRNPTVGNDRSLTKSFRLLISGIVLSRIIWIAVPVDWSVTVVGVLGTDFLLAAIVWVKWTGVQKVEGREDADFVFNLAFWLLLVGFLGSRIFWVFTTDAGRDKFVENPLMAMIAVWDGGIVWYGGLICSALFGAWYLWGRDRSIMELGDILMAGVALTLFIGRWACLCAGDDFGKPAEGLAWGVVFPEEPRSLIPFGLQGTTALHPTQLYMSLNGLIGFLICAAILRRKRFHGQVTYIYLILYAVGRSIIEIYRGDLGRGLYDVGLSFQVSSSQLISVPVVIVAALLYLRGWRKSRSEGADSAPPQEAGTG